jgi:catechol 2,3-dioxygenase-like lactoylglutathione lyase family enzyme
VAARGASGHLRDVPAHEEQDRRAPLHAARLVPELICADVECSLRFYTEVLGFTLVYARPEERFAYLDREGAQLMLEQPTARAFHAAELVRPYGRGINLQIEVADVDALRARVLAAGSPLFLDMEEKWYRRGETRVGNRQFIVQDPDGYLLRFFQDLGARNAAALP